MRLIQSLLRPIFYLLYHQFSWTYDFVAAIVSLGRWKDWVQTTVPYLHGHVLEIGFGPGHLQLFLNKTNNYVVGLDESRQMARQAGRRLRKHGSSLLLSRGYAQNIPFANKTFDSVVATFPSEYIFDPLTLKEIRRVLVPTGRLVILPIAWITGKRPLEQLAAWLFRITGEAPGKPGPISAASRDLFTHAGFEVRSEVVNLNGSQALVLIATL